MLKTSLFGQERLPLVVEPGGETGSNADALAALYAEHEAFLEGKLLEHGALLFRGFDVDTPEALERFARAASRAELLGYADGTSPRTKVKGGVYTSTEYPAPYFISLHNELSYTHRWPGRLFFCCAVEPGEGGETPIVDSRLLLQSIPETIVAEFRSKGVRYVRNLHGGRGVGLSLQSVFETGDPPSVESYCREGGVEFEWTKAGGIRLTQTRPATAAHPETGEEVWFNQADQFHPTEMDEQTRRAVLSVMKEEELPKNAYLGDGTPLDVSMLEEIRRATRDRMVLFPSRAGDLLLLDNMLVSHGRMPFKGPRKILVAMS